MGEGQEVWHSRLPLREPVSRTSLALSQSCVMSKPPPGWSGKCCRRRYCLCWQAAAVAAGVAPPPLAPPLLPLHLLLRPHQLRPAAAEGPCPSAWRPCGTAPLAAPAAADHQKQRALAQQRPEQSLPGTCRWLALLQPAAPATLARTAALPICGPRGCLATPTRLQARARLGERLQRDCRKNCGTPRRLCYPWPWSACARPCTCEDESREVGSGFSLEESASRLAARLWEASLAEPASPAACLGESCILGRDGRCRWAIDGATQGASRGSRLIPAARVAAGRHAACECTVTKTAAEQKSGAQECR